jgi:hypothetical protein
MKPTANMPSAAVTAAARKLVVATLTYRTRLVWRGDGMVGVGLRAAERRAFALTTSFSGWNGRIRSCGCSYAN